MDTLMHTFCRWWLRKELLAAKNATTNLMARLIVAEENANRFRTLYEEVRESERLRNIQRNRRNR